MTCRYRCAFLLVMAALSSSCVTSVVAQENRGTFEQQAACAPDAFRRLQQLHSRSDRRCKLPTAEDHRTERCMPVGFRPSCQGG